MQDRARPILASFFFQAEDGIRDLTVTGVQTCALPISPGSPSAPTPHKKEVRSDRRGAEGDPGVPGVQGQPDLRRDPHHLPGLPQGLPDPGRDPGDADQRGAALDPRRVSAGAATQAVILAGGQGTRLRPLTLARAKPVVPLLNRPFLTYQLALLRQHGVTDVILACSYRVDDVRAALGEAEHLGVRLRYVIEAEPLGTGGGIRNAADLASGTVWVLNGDVLTDAHLPAMRAFHEARGSRA